MRVNLVQNAQMFLQEHSLGSCMKRVGTWMLEQNGKINLVKSSRDLPFTARCSCRTVNRRTTEGKAFVQ
jgi:hypothetical protein